MVPWNGPQCVIGPFPDPTHLLYNIARKFCHMSLIPIKPE